MNSKSLSETVLKSIGIMMDKILWGVKSKIKINFSRCKLLRFYDINLYSKQNKSFGKGVGSTTYIMKSLSL